MAKTKDAESNRFGTIRRDYRTDKYTVYSLVRKNRPVDYLKGVPIENLGAEKCPFEYGKEPLNETIFTIGEPWRVRVIKNKYPFFTPDAGIRFEGHGMFREMSNYGRSYVIIDTPKHSHKFEDFTHTEINDLADSLSSLENSMYEDSKIKFVWINKDYGPMSSGTLSHSHWQEFGYPVMPFEIANRARIAKRFMRSNGECLMEHALGIEEPRVLFRSKNIVAFAPFASLYTGESIVLPKEHVPRFGMLGEEARYELLNACARIVRANNSIFGEHSYNVLFYGLKDDGAFHAYAEIIPRLGHLGPMQFAGMYGSNLIPEDYADMIRKANGGEPSKEQGTSLSHE